jgi:hypothetical protein
LRGQVKEIVGDGQAFVGIQGEVAVLVVEKPQALDLDNVNNSPSWIFDLDKHWDT